MRIYAAISPRECQHPGSQSSQRPHRQLMAHDTRYGHESREAGAQRPKRVLRAALLAVGISLALTLPDITGWIVLEVRMGGDELCVYEGTSAPGIWIEDRYESKIKCKLLLHRVLLFWGLAAAFLLPLGGVIAVARYFMRRSADQAGPSSDLYKRDQIVCKVGGGALVVYVFAMTLHNLLVW